MLEWSRVFVAKPRVVIIREDRTGIIIYGTIIYEQNYYIIMVLKHYF